MANRFPLIIDTNDGNKFKELPAGDNLNLQGSGIINAASIQVQGNLDVQSLTVNQQQLSTVAVTGDYNDLNNVPTGFSGSYNDLSNKPTIPTTTKGLTDVSVTDPTNGQILVYNSAASRYEPRDQTDIDLSASSINDLQDVITTGTTDLKYLKYQSGAWRPSNINYSEILNKPVNVSQFVNDTGYLTSQYFAAGPDPIEIDATTIFTGENVHFGIETFNARLDLFGNTVIDNLESQGDFFVNTNVVNMNGDGGLILTSTNGDLLLQGIGLRIDDGGAGSLIEDATQLNIGGNVSFEFANVTNLKADIIANNLDETVIIDHSTQTGVFANLETNYLNVRTGTAPSSNLGQAGDKSGDIIFGQDEGGGVKYMYYCGADYDGVTAIWYRTQMTNVWS